jgi:hypothetical protein
LRSSRDSPPAALPVIIILRQAYLSVSKRPNDPRSAPVVQLNWSAEHCSACPLLSNDSRWTTKGHQKSKQKTMKRRAWTCAVFMHNRLPLSLLNNSGRLNGRVFRGEPFFRILQRPLACTHVRKTPTAKAEALSRRSNHPIQLSKTRASRRNSAQSSRHTYSRILLGLSSNIYTNHCFFNFPRNYGLLAVSRPILYRASVVECGGPFPRHSAFDEGGSAAFEQSDPNSRPMPCAILAHPPSRHRLEQVRVLSSTIASNATADWHHF